MTYAISDIHGCYEEYIKLLEKINFSENDTLYILGDICDRGEKPMEIYNDIMARDNVIPLFGNHEHLAYINLRHLIKREQAYKRRTARPDRLAHQRRKTHFQRIYLPLQSRPHGFYGVSQKLLNV